jgi:putative hydrolase of the HAD superfamily
MSIKTLFLDLDDTVYPSNTGLWEAIGDRINQFMIERVHLPPEGIVELRERLYHTYGTTMRGLAMEYQIDIHDYLAYVHDVPLKNYIHPDPALYRTLCDLPYNLVVFTNADSAHAHRVMDIIGINDLVSGVIDILAVSPFCKPQKGAFEKALALTGETNPSTVAFFDDNVANLKIARQMGFFTIRVGKRQFQPEYHASINVLRDLNQVLDHSRREIIAYQPELF